MCIRDSSGKHLLLRYYRAHLTSEGGRQPFRGRRHAPAIRFHGRHIHRNGQLTRAGLIGRMAVGDMVDGGGTLGGSGPLHPSPQRSPNRLSQPACCKSPTRRSHTAKGNIFKTTRPTKRQGRPKDKTDQRTRPTKRQDRPNDKTGQSAKGNIFTTDQTARPTKQHTEYRRTELPTNSTDRLTSSSSSAGFMKSKSWILSPKISIASYTWSCDGPDAPPWKLPVPVVDRIKLPPKGRQGGGEDLNMCK